MNNSDRLLDGAWWDFADTMIAEYDDGYISSPGHQAPEIGYPQNWLNESGWQQGPVSYTDRSTDENTR